MTDLKPEDHDTIRETMEALGVAGSSLTERHRKLLIAGRDAISDLLWEHDSLLADRARMEKALREIAEDFGDFAEGKTTVEKYSLWRDMAFEQSEIARQALGASQ